MGPRSFGRLVVTLAGIIAAASLVGPPVAEAMRAAELARTAVPGLVVGHGHTSLTVLPWNPADGGPTTLEVTPEQAASCRKEGARTPDCLKPPGK